jgi:hypothetical protein
MISHEEIDKAIAAHGAWKDRLTAAVDTGKLEIPIATIRTDNACAFGMWLFGTTITADDKSTPQYKEIMKLHAEFHRTAARIAELALSGRKEEAQTMLQSGKEYAKISGQLQSALKKWKESALKPVAR